MKVILKKGIWVLQTKYNEFVCVGCKIHQNYFYFCTERKKIYCKVCLKNNPKSRTSHTDYYITEVEVV